MNAGGDAPKIFTAEYYRRMAILESTSWWNAGMRDVAASLLRTLDLPRTGILLDVGTGSGQTARWFLEQNPHWRAVGLDAAIDGLATAHALGVTPLMGDAQSLPIGTAAVDLVIAFDVLQHLPLDGGDERALGEMKRVLIPGGALLARTNAQTFPRVPPDRAASFKRYTPGELRASLDRAGFTVTRLGRINALLGLAEIPRELRARRRNGARYTGILARPNENDRLSAAKRAWLRTEGRAVRAGLSLPFGRTILALCTA